MRRDSRHLTKATQVGGPARHSVFTWVRAGLPLEHLRQLLGLSSMTGVLPYAKLATQTLEQRVERVGPALDARLLAA